MIGAVYALCFPAPAREQIAATAERFEAEVRAARQRAGQDEALTEACTSSARELLPGLSAGCRLIIRPPFVIAGDYSEADLDKLYREIVLPVTSALWRSYFDRKPDKPVTIVTLSSQASYGAAAAELDGYEPLGYAGYTQRGQRRIVVNLSTGQGTLAHELAHMLALFDFPEMPEWFDEGLAALHEEAHFSDDGLTLVGTSNWRSRFLREALARNQLPPLASVIRNPAFRGEGEGLNYAIVRCFCHYLQERQLLSHFYRKFRTGVELDPTGITTLCELLGAASIEDVDRDFRAWVSSHPATE
jgi:hypothetical protein